MGKKKKYNNTDRLFFLCIMGLAASLAWFSILLYRGTGSAKKICQQIVSLGGIPYDEAFLSEAAKLSGIRSVSPVRRVSVRLRAGDYSMDTELLAVNLDELLMKGTTAENISFGSSPVLLVGEKSLAGMTDSNGHSMSEKLQEEYLANFSEITWQYQLMEQADDGTQTTSGVSSAAVSDSTDSSVTFSSAITDSTGSSLASDSDSSTLSGSVSSSGDDTWLPCQVAAVLSDPSDSIYISYDQALELTGLSSQSDDITEILLTVRGENNMEKALASISADKSA